MSGQSAIEWTDATWNPVTGCDRVSPGCVHCYALDLAARLKGMGQARYQRDGDPKTSGPGFGVTLHPDKLEEPLRWRKPRMVFVNSMSDLFHEEVPDEYIDLVFGVMALSGVRYVGAGHTFQVLTKRPERMRDYMDDEAVAGRTFDAMLRLAREGRLPRRMSSHLYRRADAWYAFFDWPPRCIWLGVSIENRRYVDRADRLRETPAAVRFISAEPLLGPLRYDTKLVWHPGTEPAPAFSSGTPHFAPQLDLTGIDWLIVGGESGPKHRPMRAEWVRDLRDACVTDPHACRRPTGTGGLCALYRKHTVECMGPPGTAFFFKQWGGRTPKAGGRELDGRTWDELPEVAR